MACWLSDRELNRILGVGLGQIARFARRGYKSCGRGTVAITPLGDAGPRGDATYRMRYLRYDPARRLPGPQTCRIIDTYHPLRELVVQYPRKDGTVRTLQLPSHISPLARWRRGGYCRLKQLLQSALGKLS